MKCYKKWWLLIVLSIFIVIVNSFLVFGQEKEGGDCTYGCGEDLYCDSYDNKCRYTCDAKGGVCADKCSSAEAELPPVQKRDCQINGLTCCCPEEKVWTGSTCCLLSYFNECDSTDSNCGVTRDTTPYNECDLTSDIACGTETDCNDNYDHDCDKLTDCDDSDCSSDPACSKSNGESCSNNNQCQSKNCIDNMVPGGALQGKICCKPTQHGWNGGCVDCITSTSLYCARDDWCCQDYTCDLATARCKKSGISELNPPCKDPFNCICISPLIQRFAPNLIYNPGFELE